MNNNIRNSFGVYSIGELVIPDIGLCSVEVYRYEDDHIPHMHISNMDKSFHTCLCIYESKYYYHNNEFKIDKFTYEQLEVFTDWMGTPINKNGFFKHVTFWGYSSVTWDFLNPKCKYNIFISYGGTVNYNMIEEEGWEPPEGHSREMTCYIGQIDLPDIGICEVQVYNFENNDLVPHFHIFNEDNSFHTCVCIYEAKYYNHSNMIINKFTEKQLEVFVNWIKLQNIRTRFNQTNWEGMCFCWEICNRYIDDNITCPNYSKLNNF